MKAKRKRKLGRTAEHTEKKSKKNQRYQHNHSVTTLQLCPLPFPCCFEVVGCAKVGRLWFGIPFRIAIGLERRRRLKIISKDWSEKKMFQTSTGLTVPYPNIAVSHKYQQENHPTSKNNANPQKKKDSPMNHITRYPHGHNNLRQSHKTPSTKAAPETSPPPLPILYPFIPKSSASKPQTRQPHNKAYNSTHLPLHVT